jgi:hypothetical protein
MVLINLMTKKIFLIAAAFLMGCSVLKSPEKTCSTRYALAGDLTRYPIISAETQQGMLEIIQIHSVCDDKGMDIMLRTQLNTWTPIETPVTMEIPYFVAVVDGQENIHDHQSFTLKYKGFGPVDIQTHKQHYTLSAHMNKETMRVIVGFSLSADQRRQVIKSIQKRQQKAQAF